MKVAALLASFNRKEKTLRCIQQLMNQNVQDHVTIDIYLTDDASTDGTADAISKSYPNVNLYSGNGYYYWAGGMRSSWKNALKDAPDFYLLINDDVSLFENAIQSLIDNAKRYEEQNGTSAMFVGASVGDDGEVSYGGRKLYSWHRPQYYLMPPTNEQQECDLGDGNIMFVPKAVVEKVGILSEEWTHGIADHDYCYRVKAGGFKIILIPSVHGHCKFDHGKGWKSMDVKLADRIKYLYSPTGLQYKEYLKYIRRYYPYNFPLAFAKLWVKTLFPFIYDKYKKDLR